MSRCRACGGTGLRYAVGKDGKDYGLRLCHSCRGQGRRTYAGPAAAGDQSTSVEGGMAFAERVQQEQQRQRDKWGEQSHSDAMWLTIAVEEVGEIARAILDAPDNPEHIDTEMVHLAAVLASWADCRERRLRGAP